MGLSDKLKQGGESLKQAADARRQRMEEGKHAFRDAEASRQAEAAAREQERLDRRQRCFEEVQRLCPLPVSLDHAKLPGGLDLFEDEFVVTVGRDWGWSSQRLILTTHRVIHARGRALTSKDQQTVYLRDIRDVRFHKPLVGFGTLALETAGAGSIEGLPAAKNGGQIRNQLMQLIHFARSRAEQGPAAPPPSTPTNAENIAEKLKQLGELKDSGLITQDEFDAKKADLLERL